MPDVQPAAAPSSPAATPASTPSVPSSPAPAASPAAGSGPKTAADALKGAEARLSGAPASPAGTAPDQGANDGKPPVAASVPPVDGQQPTPQAGEGGIAQLRTAYQGLKTKLSNLAWAESINPQEAQTAIELLQELRTNPVAFYRQLNQDLIGRPEYANQLQQQPQAQEEQEPQADLVTTGPDGRKIQVYSSEQLQKWRDWNNSRLMSQVDAKLNPLNEFHRSQQEYAQEMEIRDRAKTHSESVMADMRKMPHFAGPENEEKIATKLRAIPPHIKKQVGAVAALNMAYNQHLRDNIFPTLNAAAEQRVREENARKANAGAGTVTPGGGNQPRGVVAPKNVNELAGHMKKLAGVQ